MVDGCVGVELVTYHLDGLFRSEREMEATYIAEKMSMDHADSP